MNATLAGLRNPKHPKIKPWGEEREKWYTPHEFVLKFCGWDTWYTKKIKGESV